MTDSPLLIKSKAFALEIIRVCNEIKRIRPPLFSFPKSFSEKRGHNDRPYDAYGFIFA